jgi:hypothetical protein
MMVKLGLAALMVLGSVSIGGSVPGPNTRATLAANADDGPHLYHCTFLLGNSTERFSLDVTAKNDAEAIKKVKSVHASAKSIVVTRGAKA